MEEPPEKKSREANPSEFENCTIQKCETLVNSIPCLNYDTLRIIFQYLSFKDLENAAKVCRSWLEAAHKEKQSRKHPEYILRTGLFCSFAEEEPVWIKPSIGFHFIKSSQSNFVRDVREKRLPKNYDSLILEVSGVIVDDIEMESCCSAPRILSAHLPQIPNVQISTFVTNRDIRSRDVISVEEAFKTFIDNLITNKTSKQNHEDSLCLMLFCNYSNRVNAFKAIATLKERCKNKRVSVWGGVVDRIHNEVANKARFFRNMQVAVVAISGLMQSWSVVIDIKYETKQEIENRLTVFKDQIKLKKYTMGFMFACTARGRSLHKGEKNVESTIFKRLFPQVPLIGCFGDGEFGIDTDPISVDKADEQEKSGEKKHSSSSHKAWYNEFSTVFMILTYD